MRWNRIIRNLLAKNMKDIMLFNGIKIEAEIIQENDNDDNDEIEEE